jgi:serine protease inhibitor
MTQGEHGVTLAHKLEGPTYKNGQWIASVELRGIEPQTFYGTTQKEVQAQMLEYLDQIVQELERAHASLHAILGNPPEQQKESE